MPEAKAETMLVEAVPANWSIAVTQKIDVVEVRFDRFSGQWTPQEGHFEVRPQIPIFTHVLPIFFASRGSLNVLEWQGQRIEDVDRYHPQIFLIPGEMSADTYILLPLNAQVRTTFEGVYSSRIQLKASISDVYIATSRYDPSTEEYGVFNLMLPMDVDEWVLKCMNDYLGEEQGKVTEILSFEDVVPGSVGRVLGGRFRLHHYSEDGYSVAFLNSQQPISLNGWDVVVAEIPLYGEETTVKGVVINRQFYVPELPKTVRFDARVFFVNGQRIELLK